jgi:alkanesulfonate monooxygenase SsuD/methylene tetrahydromethanopterin reductase-like flavin-dependent oxidoreductase (luciferase family)
MAGLDIGYLLPTRDQDVLGESEPARLVGQARRAEALGFDSVWAGDSPVTRPRADALLLLAAAANATERVRLGTAVMLPALRHPILLAHQLATLDRLSHGRLIAGMGGGFPKSNTRDQFAAVGIAFGSRTSRLEESVDAMRPLWSGDVVSRQGRHLTFIDGCLVPRPYRPGGPPIGLAGNGQPALRRVARLADGWLPYPPTPAMYAGEHNVIREVREKTPTPHRPLTPALYATVCLDEEPQHAGQRLRGSIERYYKAPLESVASIQAMFAGTAGQIAEWLRGYVEAGVRHLVIRFAPDDHASGLEEFAARVLPLLRKEDSR